MIMADMGAEVVKIEIPPGGDDTRKVAPFVKGESAYFLSVNRGKESLLLDLKSAEGKEIIQRMIRWGDVFIESNRGSYGTIGLGL